MIWLFSSSSFREKWSLITMTRNSSRINTAGVNKQILQHSSNVSNFRWIQTPLRQYVMWSFRNSCSLPQYCHLSQGHSDIYFLISLLKPQEKEKKSSAEGQLKLSSFWQCRTRDICWWNLSALLHLHRKKQFQNAWKTQIFVILTLFMFKKHALFS